MKIGYENLSTRSQTAKRIYSSAEYWRDLGSGLDTDLRTWFEYVRQIPYFEDTEAAEIVGRPKHLLNEKLFPYGLDCKKKAVLIGAWLNAHGIKWRLVTVSEKKNKEIHHIFPQAFLNGTWKNIDATYSDYELFENKPEVTRAQIYEQKK